MAVLTLVDILGIQDYVFASNKLKDVIGGSQLTKDTLATSGLLKKYEKSIIINSGGNALLKFNDKTEAHEFAADLSRQVITRTPNLDIAISHDIEYEEGSFKLAEHIKLLQKKMAITKFSRRPSVPLLGLGINENCSVTGLPANAISKEDKDSTLISEDIKLRREELKKDRDYWEKLLDIDRKKYAFPKKLDDIGRSFGEKSMIATVHIDGNDFGNRFLSWLKNQEELQANQELTNKKLEENYGKLSRDVENVFINALKSSLDKLCSIIKIDKKEIAWVKGNYGEFALKTSDNKIHLLPIRPIILGGDDLTFICDARIALELSAEILKTVKTNLASIPEFHYQSHDTSVPPEPAYASAGIAIVHSHSPFSQAYRLAELLCQEAKSCQLGIPSYQKDCTLNWQIGMQRQGIRTDNSETKNHHHKLSCKPYGLTPVSNRLSWEWLSKDLLGSKGFQGAPWKDSGQKLHVLSELATFPFDKSESDSSPVKTRLKAWNAHEGSKFKLPLNIETGVDISMNATPILDALELLDLHLGIEDKNDT